MGRRDRRLRRTYGVSEEQVLQRSEAQGGRCAICDTEAELVVDHDHAVKNAEAVRGMLCPTCNLGLGHFKDSPELLEAAARYLRSYSRELSSRSG
jgi:hypothetical protein